jgi:FKBP-type peptidyl-prolyl cis-trans isomerase 2
MSKETINNRTFKAKKGDIVRIHFTCKLKDGTVFDSSIEHEPLEFSIGEGQLAIPGLEEAVIGMTPGEEKTVAIPSEKAFGSHLSEKTHTIGLDQFPSDIHPEIGMTFEIRQADGKITSVKITHVSDSSVTLDSNHPLAGCDLLFEIKLLKIIPDNTNLSEEYYKKAVSFHNKGLIEEAIFFYQKTIELNRNHANAYFNLGVALQQNDLIDRAIICYEKATGLNQDFVEAHHNLGVAYNVNGLFDKAALCFQKVLQLQPDHPGACYNLGNTLVAQSQFEDALHYYRRAIEIIPEFADAHFAIALINLRSGKFEEGWTGFEWRWKLKDVVIQRSFSEPRWEGSDITGKTILLYAEQGLGDTIQFIRYAPLLALKGAKVIFESQEELVSLLRNVEGIQMVYHQGKTLPSFDLHCSLLSLPLIFKTTSISIPDNIPYITADPDLVKKWYDKLAGNNSQLKIGIIWAGDPRPKYGHIRSCPLENFAPLAEMDNICFYSLQKGGPSRQVFAPPAGMKIIDYSVELTDFSETAALIENLDLIISVDTAVAHLSGALGKPVWLLLPFVSDWRWMLNRKDSPWYPTMKLFRQEKTGDWKPVIKNIKDALDTVVHKHS